MSQNTKILKYLKRGNKLTALKALAMFGVMRLASRINELRNSGNIIESKLVKKNKKIVSEYRILKK